MISDDTKQKILVVDNMDGNLTLIKRVVESLDITIDTSLSGEDAIKQCATTLYSLAIVSFNMSVMSGPECVKKIRNDSKHRNLPVLFIAVHGSSNENIRIAYEAGCIDYIVKPFDDVQLRLKIQNILHNERIRSRGKYEEDILSRSKHGVESVLDQVGEGVILFDKFFKVIFCNKAASTLLLESANDVIGKHLKDFINPDDSDEEWCESDFAQIFYDAQSHQKDEAYFWRAKLSKFPVQYTQSTIFYENDITGILFFHDDTEKMKIKQELSVLANYDHLTGVANRSLFMSYLDKTLAAAKRHKLSFGVLIIDLDDFKSINDNYGHSEGDEALRYICKTIGSVIRSDDLLARIGGDEFALIVSNVNEAYSVAVVADKIQKNITGFVCANGKEILTGCSIGIAFGDSKTISSDVDGASILKKADVALYKAKNKGKGTYEFFSLELQQSIEEKKRLIRDIQRALDNDEFEMYFQPQVNISNGKLYGLEALIRWETSHNSFISPATFIPVAEENGKINKIGGWCINRVCQRVSQLRDIFSLSDDFAVSINVSAYQLGNESLFNEIVSSMKKYKLPPGCIHIEVTETAIMNDVKISVVTLEQLRKVGVNVSIDDFGTGYSSLSYLKILPLDMLKIDQSFIQCIGIDKNDEAIVDAIIQLAKNLELTVIAEGVETEQQEKFLTEHGCHYVQGYLYSRPLDFDDLTKYLHKVY